MEDVKEDVWYYKYSYRTKSGVVQGIGDNKFGIGSNITRQDMAVMAYRAPQIAGINIKNENLVRPYRCR